jgi:sulfite oxidase
VRLVDLLELARVKSTAVFTGHYGADPSGEPGVGPFSRGVPIAKALDRHNLLAWAINDEPLPLVHGFPLRLLIPGWPASVSAKWLTRIWIRDRTHDGRGMGGTSYRVPTNPMIPGGEADPSDFRDIESMPVRSIITRPADGARLPAGTRQLTLRGAAWAGELTVREVDVTIDSGATWQRAELGAPRNRYDWQRWTATVPLPRDGYYELAVRATDSNGVMQPFSPRNWNPQGYGGNSMHRIAVVVG